MSTTRLNQNGQPFKVDERGSAYISHLHGLKNELERALKAMLAHTEPNCGVTSPQSVWNVARRVLAEVNGGAQ